MENRSLASVISSAREKIGISKRELSKYINYVKSFTDMYILKEMYNYNQLLLYLIAIYPLMPFLAEEIYEEKFSKKNSIINEGWI